MNEHQYQRALDDLVGGDTRNIEELLRFAMRTGRDDDAVFVFGRFYASDHPRALGFIRHLAKSSPAQEVALMLITPRIDGPMIRLIRDERDPEWITHPTGSDLPWIYTLGIGEDTLLVRLCWGRDQAELLCCDAVEHVAPIFKVPPFLPPTFLEESIALCRQYATHAREGWLDMARQIQRTVDIAQLVAYYYGATTYWVGIAHELERFNLHGIEEDRVEDQASEAVAWALWHLCELLLDAVDNVSIPENFNFCLFEAVRAVEISDGGISASGERSWQDRRLRKYLIGELGECDGIRILV